MALLDRSRDTEPETHGTPAGIPDPVEHGPRLAHVGREDVARILHVGTVVAGVAGEIPFEAVGVVLRADLLGEGQTVGADLGNREVAPAAHGRLAVVGRRRLVPQLVLRVVDGEFALPQIPVRVAVVESGSNPVFESGILGGLHHLSPRIDPLFPQAPHDLLLPPLADKTNLLVVERLALGHLRGPERRGVPEGVHVMHQGVDLRVQVAPHRLVNEFVLRQWRGTVKQETGVVVVEEARSHASSFPRFACP